MSCFLYVRVSTEKQAERQLSIPAQLLPIKERAKKHGGSLLASTLMKENQLERLTGPN
jgi:DNA invertase Pin-like site-specific DNA recombinase